MALAARLRSCSAPVGGASGRVPTLPPTVGSGGDAMRAVWLILLLWLRNREAMGQVSSVVREVALVSRAVRQWQCERGCAVRGARAFLHAHHWAMRYFLGTPSTMKVTSVRAGSFHGSYALPPAAVGAAAAGGA